MARGVKDGCLLKGRDVYRMHTNLESLRRRARALKKETYALLLAYGDPRTPWHAKVWTMVVLAYAASPIDLVPDFVPVLGYLDDLLLVPLGIALALRMIPAEVMADCRQRAAEADARAGGRAWLGALIVAAVWLLGLGITALIVWRATRG